MKLEFKLLDYEYVRCREKFISERAKITPEDIDKINSACNFNDVKDFLGEYYNCVEKINEIFDQFENMDHFKIQFKNLCIGEINLPENLTEYKDYWIKK